MGERAEKGFVEGSPDGGQIERVSVPLKERLEHMLLHGHLQ